MSMQVRPDYVSPLSMMADKSDRLKPGQPAEKQGGYADKVTELQNKQQQLQNQMLLLKATGTDGAGAAEDTQKVLEAQLEKVTAELRTAKTDCVQTTEQTEQSSLDTQPSVRRSRDLYEPTAQPKQSPLAFIKWRKIRNKGTRFLFYPIQRNELKNDCRMAAKEKSRCTVERCHAQSGGFEKSEPPFFMTSRRHIGGCRHALTIR